MPVTNHRRVSFKGCFGDPLKPYELWSFRLNMAVGGALAKTQAMADSAATACQTLLTNVASSNVTLLEVKVADISSGTVANPGGVYVDAPVITAVVAPAKATGGTIKWPPQVSLAVSLNTATRGPRGRGRFYLPGPSGDLSALTGGMTAATAQSVATSAASFLQTLNDIPGLGNLVVASSYGGLPPVTSVRVGTVYDTIRSRRTSIPEAYGANLAVLP